LPAAEMARARQKNNPLIELSDLDAEPSFVLAAHVCSDDAGSDLLIKIAIGPFDADRPRGGTGADEPLPGKSIQMESKPVFQASTLTWARHSMFTLLFC